MKKAGFILLLLTLTITQAACRLTAQPQPQPVEPTRASPTEVKPYQPDPAQSGAALPPPTLVPMPSATTYVKPALPVLYGLWMKEHDQQRDLLTFTESSIYLVEADNGSLHESFYEIQSVDWVNGLLDIKLKRVRVNGSYGGFDSPSKVMKISIDGETLFFSTVDVGMDLPSTAENGPWLRQ
jgi:hypothetical protein